MKKFLFIFLIIFSTSIYAEWTFFSTNQQGREYYINLNDIRKVNGYVNYWLLSDYKKKDEWGDLSSKLYIRGDCKNYRMKFLQLIFHNGEMGDGGVSSMDNTEGEWIYPPSDSPFGISMELSCSLINERDK